VALSPLSKAQEFSMSAINTLIGAVKASKTAMSDPVVAKAVAEAQGEITGLRLHPQEFPMLQLGHAADLHFRASGGQPPYTFMIDGLPHGLSLSDDGAITGTPTGPGGSFTAKVTDDLGAVATAGVAIQTYGVQVEPDPALAKPVTPAPAPLVRPAAPAPTIQPAAVAAPVVTPPQPVITAAQESV
jgi:hypothetical protein